MDSTEFTPAPNGQGITPDEVRRFLEALADGASVSAAARAIGYTRSRMYQLRSEHPGFSQAWAEAYEEGTDTYEDALNSGKKAGNQAAIIFGLKCRRPEIYNPKIQIAPDRTAAPGVSEAILEGERAASEPLMFRSAPALPPPPDDGTPAAAAMAAVVPEAAAPRREAAAAPEASASSAASPSSAAAPGDHSEGT